VNRSTARTSCCPCRLRDSHLPIILFAIRSPPGRRDPTDVLRMMVIGTGDYLEAARQLVTCKQLDQCITLVDQVPVQEMPRLLAAADVGLVPTRASNATHLLLPVKLLDYMALCIPTIAARRLRSMRHESHRRDGDLLSHR